jgi:hypothetical protein
MDRKLNFIKQELRIWLGGRLCSGPTSTKRALLQMVPK